jgi:hypothetical protein
MEKEAIEMASKNLIARGIDPNEISIKVTYYIHHINH